MLAAVMLTACSDSPQNSTQQTSAAPKSSTASAIISESLEIPQFSVNGGFYSSPVQLAITAAHGTVYYTTDGSMPTADSTKYTAPITIDDRSHEPNKISMYGEITPDNAVPKSSAPDFPVDKATVVKAVTVDENGLQSAAAVQTFLIGFDSKMPYYQQVPVISLITDESNLFDRDTGIYVLGNTYEKWQNGSEYDTAVPDYFMPANYTQHGKEWERPAVIQYFENGKQVFTENIGIRIHGNATRSYPQKSFNLYARSEYGASKLNYDIFAGAVKSRSDSKPITEFDSLILRNGGNDAMFTRFRDKLNQALVSDRAFLTQGMRPCIVFLNGEFWGHYEITEKLDSDFIKAHCGVPKKDICIIKKDTLEKGGDADYAEFEQLRKWIRETDFSDQDAYEKLCRCVDMQSFTDYMSCEFYMNNANWDVSNSAMWKAVRTDENNPYADGKWRFLMFDTEYSTGIYGQASAADDTFDRILKKDCFLSDLFRGALENAGFRKQFADTFTEIAQTNFSTERVNDAIDRLEREYHDMVIDTYNRFWKEEFGGDSAEDNFTSEVRILRSFYENRYANIMEYLKTHCPQ